MKTICKAFISIALIVFSCLGVSAQSEVKKKVAVYITGDDVENSVKKIIGAKLVTAITASGEYAAVERTADFLAALEKESDYQTSGEVRDSQIAKLGQKFGVRFVVVADVSEAFDELFVASRLINVETGLVERAYDASGPAESMPQLIKLSQEVAAGLLNGIVASTTPASGLTTTTKKTQSGQHKKVDLGLPSGIKWATINVGANSPSDYGNYYAWGETEPKSEYLNSNCVTHKKTFGDIGGNPQYDVARAKWGDNWRLPTDTEWEELINKCKWTAVTMDNHNVWRITGPNGNSIMLPLGGYRKKSDLKRINTYGYYWSSTPTGVLSVSCDFGFDDGSGLSQPYRTLNHSYRDEGFSVRPVSD